MKNQKVIPRNEVVTERLRIAVSLATIEQPNPRQVNLLRHIIKADKLVRVVLGLFSLREMN